MRPTLLAALAALVSSAAASPAGTLGRRALTDAIVAKTRAKLAARQSSTGTQTTYAPLKGQPCPFPSGTNYMRDATGLSPNETDYVAARLDNAKDSLRAFFTRSNVAVDGLDDLISDSSTTPRVAIAISGGGYRAMLHGSGGLAALDARNNTVVSGLLQGSVYMAGLSGGSWAVTSFAAADMASPYYLDSNVWNLEESLVDPSGFINAVEYYADIVSDVLDKRSAGFDTSITDLWARALSYHLFDNNIYPDHAATSSFGPSIRATTTFQNHSMPYPLVIALEREPGQLIVGQNASIFVFDPFEYGSSEPLGGFSLGGTRGAYAPLDYVGTNWEGGKISDNQCITGFTNLGFVPATSATLFNQLLNQLGSSGSSLSGTIEKALAKAIEEILSDVSKNDDDIAPYRNPFYQYEPNTNAIANLTSISMVDGGEALDNIPLWPLLDPAREVDFIIAFDSSADTNFNWPNGTAMIATHNRTIHNDELAKYSMPNVPTNPNSWVNLGLNSRPTFFGCDASDVTNYNASSSVKAPVIAYVPAYPWSTFANSSTFQLAYEKDESVAHLNNGWRSTTLNETVADWPACLACAAIKRSVERSGKSHSAQCTQCYSTWCWNGTTNDTKPAEWEPLLGSLPLFVAEITNQSQITPGTVFPASGALATVGDVSVTAIATTATLLLGVLFMG